MKTFISKLLLLTLTSASALAAEVTWSKTKLWRIPIPNTIPVALGAPAAKSLASECQEIRDIVFDKNGKTRSVTRGMMSSLRTQPLADVMAYSFVVDFPVVTSGHNVLTNELALELQKVTDQNTANDPVPGFTQKTAEIRLTGSFPSEPNVEAVTGSLSLVSKSVGLAPSAMKLISNGREYFLRVEGKDTACDLVSKLAVVQIKAGAIGMITLEEQTKLSIFYRNATDAYQRAIKEYKSKRAQSGVISVLMNDVLPYERGSKRQLDSINFIFDTLFTDDNLTLSDVWNDGINGKHVDVWGRTLPMTVQLTLQ